MNSRILFTAILSIGIMSTAACTRDVGASQGTQASTNSYAIELFDHNKTMNVACIYLDLSAFSTRQGDPGDDTAEDTVTLTCATSLDGNTANLMEWVRNGKLLEKALVSLDKQNGRAYRLEMLGVTLQTIQVRGESLSEDPVAVSLALTARASHLVTAQQ